MKRKISLILVITMIAGMLLSFGTYAEETKSFVDYNEHWAREIISKWVAAGKIKGYEDGTFRPDNLMTRAEYATLLASVIKIQIAEPSKHEFSDVKKTDWFYDYIKKLVSLDVIDKEESYMPQSYITRQDVMTMAGRAFYYISDSSESLEKFSDKADVADYAKPYVAALIESGFVAGYEDGTLKPLKHITRAECVKILDCFNVVKDPYSLEGIMERLYDKIDTQFPNTMITPIEKEQSGYFLGIENMEFEEAIASEPLMSSIAHSICLVRVKEGTDVEKTMKDIKESVNPRKWICVGVPREEVIVANQGNLILLVIDQIAPTEFYKAFMELDVKKNEIIEPDASGLINYNGLYMDYIGEMRPTGVKTFADKVEYIASKYKNDYNKITYGVIPSKSYFINEKLRKPFDYDRMKELLSSNIKSAEYIDLFNTVKLEDYYLTDPHIKQDKLYGMVEALTNKNDVSANRLGKIESFLGQHKAKVNDIKPEEINYVLNRSIEDATVTNIMGDECTTVYNYEKLKTTAPYDFFLSGPAPIKKIVNHKVSQDKKLVIFGDSFTCSLAPLLIDQYNEINIVDLRYVASSLIKNYVDITETAEIMFIYNEQVVNNGEMLKVIFE